MGAMLGNHQSSHVQNEVTAEEIKINFNESRKLHDSMLSEDLRVLD